MMRNLSHFLRLATCAAILLGMMAAQSANAAELRVLEPADRSLIRGVVKFRVEPIYAPGESFLFAPGVTVQDEYGRDLRKVTLTKEPTGGAYVGTLDTTNLPDGLSLIVVQCRALDAQKAPIELREDLNLGIRNRATRPAKLEVEAPATGKLGQPCDLTLRVLDQSGRRMSGARVTFAVDAGELDSKAEITDSTGEAFVSVSRCDAGKITLTITLEGAAPITRVITFGP